MYAKGYLVASSKAGRQATFYSRPLLDFLPLAYDRDFATQQTITLGEILTEKIVTAQTYAKPVYVATGKQDAVFCGNGSRELGEPDCGQGQSSQVAAMKDFFPSVPANKFGYFAQPNAGHSHQLHYTAPAAFVKINSFLQQQGL